MTILNNQSRVGNFTSSKIGALTKKDRSGTGFGAPAMTYIEECNMARRLGRSLTSEVNARPTTWGHLCERFAYQKLGFDYDLTSKESFQHQTIPYWWGSPDGRKIPNTVYDLKCPMTLKSFCQLVDGGSIEAIRANHGEGDTYYWQLVSNAIITGSDFAELIVYVPFRSDLAEIRLMAEDEDRFKWVTYADDYELPFLIDGGRYKDINIIEFKVPQSDIDLLTGCVERAGKMLVDGE